jgi:hypothetical protein
MKNWRDTVVVGGILTGMVLFASHRILHSLGINHTLDTVCNLGIGLVVTVTVAGMLVLEVRHQIKN